MSDIKINMLSDGVYFIKDDTNLHLLNTQGDFRNNEDGIIVTVYDKSTKKYKKMELKEFLNTVNFKDKEIWIGSAYETYWFIISNIEPVRITSKGSGFNYGSTNIIPVSEPGYVIILAEND